MGQLLGKVADALNAAMGTFVQMVDWVVDWAIAAIMAAIQPFIDLIDSVTVPWKINMNSTLLSLSAPEKLATFDPGRAAELIWNSILFGSLWGALVGLTLALTIVTQVLTPLQFTPVGIVISVVLGLIIPIIIKAVADLIAGTDTAASKAFDNPDETWGISVVVKPEDPWWSGQLALAILSLIPMLLKLIEAGTFKKFFKGDALGVVISLVGLLTVFLGGEFGIWLGLVLTVWGMSIALMTFDTADITVISPVKYWEEILTAIDVVVTSGAAMKYYLEKY